MKIKTEVEEAKSDIASATMKTLNAQSCRNMGSPLCWLFPPGRVKAAAKRIVVIRVPTMEKAPAVSFAHFSPSFASSLCCSINISRGFFPSWFFASLHLGCTISSTACTCNNRCLRTQKRYSAILDWFFSKFFLNKIILSNLKFI
ncbi:hypothetical protein AAHE18_05G013600 [Arachis hypogaea]